VDEATIAAHKIMTRWAGTLPHHPYSDFQQKLTVTSAAESPAFIVRLMTIYDVRTPQAPCNLPLPKDGPPPVTDVWSVKVDLKADFIRDETQAVVPLSATPSPCEKCSGSGKRMCKDCNGSKIVPCPDCVGPNRRLCPECSGLGKQACMHCKGTGMVASSRDQQSPCQSCAGTGGPPCPKCKGRPLDCDVCKNTKEVACTRCNKEGQVPCEDCAGAGEVLRARGYLIEYQPLLEKRVCVDAQTPAGLLPADFPREPSGPIIGEAENDKIPLLEDQLPRADLRATLNAAIASAEAAKKDFSAEARVIKRRVTIEKIPVYSVVYEFESKKYACWVSALGDKVVAATTPFTDLSQKWAKEALERVASRDFARAEELLKNATELAPGPWLDGLKDKIEKGKTSQSSALAAGLGLGFVLLATAGLAATHRLSHHLLWPCAGFLAACGAVALASQPLLKGLLGRRGASAASVIATTALFLVVSAVNPFLRLDAAELQGLIQQRFGGAIPAALSEDDEAYLASLITTYEPLGVDTQALSDALEANKQRIADEARARAEEEAAREAQRQKLAAEKRRKAEIAAELAQAKKEAAAAAAKAKAAAAKKKKKKKKKKPVTVITDSPQ
jgi:hypothetical protein